jgi:regulatory protein
MLNPAPGQTRLPSPAAGLFTPKPTVVTALSPSRRDPTLIDVRVDDRRVISLGSESIEELKIVMGMVWTDEMNAAAIKASEVEAAHRRAVRLLTARSRSSQELIRSLIEFGYAGDVSERAVARLVACGIVDDLRYAQDYARREIDNRPASREQIEARLWELGFDPQLARKAFDAAATGETDAQRAVRVVTDSFRPRGPGPAPAPEWRRLYALLARRGFDEATAMAALEAILGPPPD